MLICGGILCPASVVITAAAVVSCAVVRVARDLVHAVQARAVESVFLGYDVRHQLSAVPVMQRVAFASALTSPGGGDDGVSVDMQLLGELGVMGADRVDRRLVRTARPHAPGSRARDRAVSEAVLIVPSGDILPSLQAEFTQASLFLLSCS